MKKARVEDYWRRTYKRKYKTSITSIKLDNKYIIDELKFTNGINAICGFNGAGKTTVISFIKDCIGLELDIYDRVKIEDNISTMSFIFDKKVMSCSNQNGNRLVDKIMEDIEIKYFSYKKSLDDVDFFLREENIDELLEQYDPYEIVKDNLEDLSYILSRDYQKVSITEIVDDTTRPYFEAEFAGIKYNSTRMGVGEQFVFRLFWELNFIETSGVILVEEPETFLNILAQKRLMNFLSKIASNKGIIIIITTHSPFILERVPLDNINIITRYLGEAVLQNLQNKFELATYLGINDTNKGILLVEDLFASVLLKNILLKYNSYILKHYEIEIVNGESDITTMLKGIRSPKFKYEIIGIYDGDIEYQIEQQKEEFNFPYLFLPIVGMEKELLAIFEKKILEVSVKLEIDLIELKCLYSSLEGMDSHDKFQELVNQYGSLGLVSILINMWLNILGNQKNVRNFIIDLQSTLSIYQDD